MGIHEADSRRIKRCANYLQMDVSDIQVEGLDGPVKLKLLVASWNVGNAKPPKLLDEWVPAGGKGYDVIVIGAQECTYSEKDDTCDEADPDEAEFERRSTQRRSSVEKMARAHFVSLLQTQVGTDFATVASVHLWQMRLIILVHHKHKDHVTAVEVTKEVGGRASWHLKLSTTCCSSHRPRALVM